SLGVAAGSLGGGRASPPSTSSSTASRSWQPGVVKSTAAAAAARPIRVLPRRCVGGMEAQSPVITTRGYRDLLCLSGGAGAGGQAAGGLRQRDRAGGRTALRSFS